MKCYELLIFDWDGTLVDSAGEIVAAMQQAIQGVGLPERTPEQMRQLIGLGLDDVIARLFPGHEPRSVRERIQRYSRRYGMQRSRARLFEPVQATLDRLTEQGFTLAVATGKSRLGLDQAMADTHTAAYFAFTRCADESVPKPAPDLVEDILLRAATPAQDALMVGDTEYDMITASQAGVDAVAVATGVHDRERLRRAGALAVLDTVEALPEWLDANCAGVAMAR